MSSTRTTTLQYANPLGSLSLTSLELAPAISRKDGPLQHVHAHISESRRSVAGSVHKSVEQLPVQIEQYELDELKQTSAPVSTTEPASHTKAVGAITGSMRSLARIQFAALCYCLFLAGWNDGTTGPLLPRIQEVYHVSWVKQR